jgi:hypothetical protein
MNGLGHSSLRQVVERRVELPRERTGGPPNRPPRPPSGGNRSDRTPPIWMQTANAGSHMPLDTMLHWEWRNPLNLLPLLLLLALLLALVALLL